MFNRVYFPLIALFWIVMNTLLWRAEFGGGREFGSAVSPEVVWQKILTAPDDSTLEISLKEKKIGYCRWSANAGEATTRPGSTTPSSRASSSDGDVPLTGTATPPATSVAR